MVSKTHAYYTYKNEEDLKAWNDLFLPIAQ
jgi:hypothetical protein